ncbi:MAG: class I SAM-dependent methyltransferase, partial [Ignavibacteriaceae bacterium]|nr:class I SAM-dependent methyltransferase [Ignavibacteriaceae bacterium]
VVTNIMDKQTEIFFEIHSGLEREAPGSQESTKNAFEILKQKEDPKLILDCGCGPGSHTRIISEISNADIVAVDLHLPFLHSLKIKSAWISKIYPLNADMSFLPFKDSVFDCVWSEGALYSIGLENALTKLKIFLKPGGFICFSELVYFTGNFPQELDEYWKTFYPGIKTEEENLQLISTLGYETISYFRLPESDWIENYYKPLEEKIKLVKSKYKGDIYAEKVIELEEQEISIYLKYKEFYGYGFYVIQRTNLSNSVI